MKHFYSSMYWIALFTELYEVGPKESKRQLLSRYLLEEYRSLIDTNGKFHKT